MPFRNRNYLYIGGNKKQTTAKQPDNKLKWEQEAQPKFMKMVNYFMN